LLQRLDVVRCARPGERAMEVILTLAILLAIWMVVIWGSSYFNKNVR
jgi:hypothetical protein